MKTKPDVLTTKQLARRWKVTSGHLANLRCYRKFPKAPRWFRIGRAIRYRLYDVMEFEGLRPR